MPELSQRTLAKVVTALTGMLPDSADTFQLMRDFWRTKLFESGFPGWLIDYFVFRGMNWALVIPELFGGNIKTKDGTVIESFLCDQMLRRLTVMAYGESKSRSVKENIRLSLQLDGFEPNGEKIGAIDGPISVEEEKSRLLKDLRASKLGRQDVIAKHITDAEDLFSDGKHHPAIGEARSALQAVIEQTVSILEVKAGKRSGSGTKNQIEFMAQHGFLSPDEQLAFSSAWGFLCSGNHPGLSSEDEGRIGMILCLEFIQILLAKGKVLL